MRRRELERASAAARAPRARAHTETEITTPQPQPGATQTGSRVRPHRSPPRRPGRSRPTHHTARAADSRRRHAPSSSAHKPRGAARAVPMHCIPRARRCRHSRQRARPTRPESSVTRPLCPRQSAAHRLFCDAAHSPAGARMQDALVANRAWACGLGRGRGDDTEGRVPVTRQRTGGPGVRRGEWGQWWGAGHCAPAILLFVRLVEVRRLGVGRARAVGVRQQRTDRDEDRADRVDRGPVVLDQVHAERAVGVDVWMELRRARWWWR